MKDLKLMKKIFLFVSLSILVNLSYSQSNVPGRISLSAGFDMGGHYIISEETYSGTVIDQDTSGAATKLFHFNAHYSLANWFSAGLGFRIGNYVEDPDDPDSKYQSNSVNEFYLDTRFYFLNKDKFNMYGMLSGGKTSFTLNHDEAGFKVTNKYSAPVIRLGLGFNWYFTKYIGLWYNMEYAGRNFKLLSQDINGTATDLTNYKFTFNTKGAHFAIGICIKFKE